MTDTLSAEREAFIATANVPRGTLEKLDRYAAMLTEWNQRVNLVSDSTMPHIWSRHFLDSWQLLKNVPRGTLALSSRHRRANIIADIGSGAGFPGLILSIFEAGHIHLIESIGKKAKFLQAVANDLGLGVTVHNARAEDIDLKADIVTARAVTALPNLLKLAHRIGTPATTYIFPKGQKAEAELTESKKHWTFHCRKTTSMTDAAASVLVITNLQWKHGPQSQRRREK